MTAPRITPTKPHFFKPLSPDFHHGILIPISFFEYLNGQKCECAVLKTSLGNWPVKINGRRFEDGWKIFTENHNLQVDDLLVFRHEGDMVFDVMVFDPNSCERKHSPIEIGDHVDSTEEQESPEPDSVKDLTRLKGSFKAKQKMSHREVKTHAATLGPQYFTSIMKRFHLKKSNLYIPKKFAELNGLSKKGSNLIIRDKKKRKWLVSLRHDDLTGRSFIGRGWKEFASGNDLKEGDVLKLELTKGGKELMMTFTVNPSGGMGENKWNTTTTTN